LEALLNKNDVLHQVTCLEDMFGLAEVLNMFGLAEVLNMF
jgi:hypothetical protein